MQLGRKGKDSQPLYRRRKNILQLDRTTYAVQRYCKSVRKIIISSCVNTGRVSRWFNAHAHAFYTYILYISPSAGLLVQSQKQYWQSPQLRCRWRGSESFRTKVNLPDPDPTAGLHRKMLL